MGLLRDFCGDTPQNTVSSKPRVALRRKKDDRGEDELYCIWYTCPKCKDDWGINEYSKFCSKCGVKVYFVED